MRFQVEMIVTGFPDDEGDALAKDVKEELNSAIMMHFDPKRIVRLEVKETTE